MKRKSILIISSSLILLILIASVQPMMAKLKPDLLADSEIKKTITKQYPGTIESIQLKQGDKKSVYLVELINEKGIYQVTVDAYEGTVVELTEQSLAITEEEAKQIAQRTVAGTIQAVTAPSPTVYMIKVQTPNKEIVTIEIDRQTGKLLSQSDPQPQPERMTEQQAKELALLEVPGVIQNITRKEENHQQLLLIEIQQMKQQRTMVVIDEATGTIKQTYQLPTSATTISEQEAKSIALKRTDGEEISYLQLLETSEGAVYQVLIEHDDETVDVRVHSVTGEVLSITTIADDDDDDED
ncbi:PepSY domain-containing protein [Bacillus sp. REN10]|uniref:PepSY domain-containing protein n=1 Tax=Bacillus sp. REN10 TaxID=2782541 RepID=UPI00193C7456|nr:PepSY domain-containing protein [Bacillus sp. REN10]